MAALAVRSGSGSTHRAGARGLAIPWRGDDAARRPVVAVLDGGAVDAEVVDLALAACLRRGSALRVVHVSGGFDAPATPLDDAYALAYIEGAIAVAHLVPGVEASAVCVERGAGGALERELANAEMLVLSAALAREIRADAPGAQNAHGCPVTSVRTDPDSPDRLRLGYRLALLLELEQEPARPDGSLTPEDLDDAWHVCVASPPLHRETIEAWAVCSAWPPRSAAS